MLWSNLFVQGLGRRGGHLTWDLKSRSCPSHFIFSTAIVSKKGENKKQSLQCSPQQNILNFDFGEMVAEFIQCKMFISLPGLFGKCVFQWTMSRYVSVVESQQEMTYR